MYLMKVILPFWSLSVPDEGYFTLLEYLMKVILPFWSLSVPDEGYFTLLEFECT